MLDTDITFASNIADLWKLFHVLSKEVSYQKIWSVCLKDDLILQNTDTLFT